MGAAPGSWNIQPSLALVKFDRQAYSQVAVARSSHLLHHHISIGTLFYVYSMFVSSYPPAQKTFIGIVSRLKQEIRVRKSKAICEILIVRLLKHVPYKM